MDDNQFLPDSRSAPAQTLLEVVSHWVQVLYGKGDLGQVLNDVRDALRAEHALISRSSSRNTVPQVIARSQDRKKQHAIADAALGDHVWTCKQGSVWYLSDLDDCEGFGGGDPTTFLRVPGNADTLILALDVGKSVADFLEISASAPFNKHECERLCATLARAWRTRPPGLAEMAYQNNRKIQSFEEHRELPKNVLEPSNPAKLSRCEFRVCTMIKYGLTTKSIASELSVHESTIRSHLRSIYSKIGVKGQMELLHCLTATQPKQQSEADVA